MIVLSTLIDTVQITLALGLAAFGLAIIYGLVGVINLGHGAMLTLGAYLYWTATTAGAPFIVGIVVAALGVAAIGLAFEHAIVRRFYSKPFDTMMITWGFFLVTSELIKIVYGTALLGVANPFPGTIHIGEVALPIYKTLLSLISLCLLGITALVFYKTDVGLRIRALTQNPEMAGLLGLNTALVYKLVFVTGSLLAGLAGALLCPLMSIDPYMGNIYLVRSFFVVIVGGVGHILGGTLVGSFFIGGLETVLANFSSQTVAQTAVFVIAAVVVRFRPQGVFRT